MYIITVQSVGICIIVSIMSLLVLSMTEMVVMGLKKSYINSEKPGLGRPDLRKEECDKTWITGKHLGK